MWVWVVLVVGIERARFEFEGGGVEKARRGVRCAMLCYAILRCTIVLWLC